MNTCSCWSIKKLNSMVVITVRNILMQVDAEGGKFSPV